jgi:hypothetical protein
MTQSSELEKQTRMLSDIEAIKKLKAKYWRFVDNKLWEDLTEVFTTDATLEYGTDNLKGRDAIIEFLKNNTGNKKIVTIHQGHNPEIEIVDDVKATGIWALHDYLIFGSRMSLNGWGHYHDEYAKVNGEWKIKSTRITRIREEWKTNK